MTWLIAIVVLLIPVVAASAEPMAPSGGGAAPALQTVPCLTDTERSALKIRLAEASRELRAAGALTPTAGTAMAPTLAWPLRNGPTLHDPGNHGISNFLDQNPANPGSILDYNCGARTYDVSGYNHQGVDFFTWPFSWYKMANDHVEIVAAAPGTIIGKDDGNNDQSCSTGGGSWNAVYVEHADGSVIWYGHMKKNSLTSKGVGQTVVEGEYLGVVGSSGQSTGPHLHMELYDSGSSLVEPYTGPCNSFNPSSWWQSQRAYHDSGINALMTLDADPVFPACPQIETPNQTSNFLPGQVAYFAAFYRDQLSGQTSQYRVRKPDGTLHSSWSHSSSTPHYAASYWYWWFTLPTNAPQGRWWFETDYEGESHAVDFFVTSTTAAPYPGAPVLAIRHRNGVTGRVDLSFTLPKAGEARVRIFDAQGRQVAVLADGTFPQGSHDLAWSSPAGGVYFARVDTGDQYAQTKFVALR